MTENNQTDSDSDSEMAMRIVKKRKIYDGPGKYLPSYDIECGCGNSFGYIPWKIKHIRFGYQRILCKICGTTADLTTLKEVWDNENIKTDKQ